ncbi:MAG: hypothetical protein ACI9XO_000816 [Paraglaciecola sp.]|jgi:hypothetical protein
MRNYYLLPIFYLLLWVLPSDLNACGYNFVSSCNTILNVEANGTNTGLYVANCGYLSSFNNHNFGDVTSIVMTYAETVTWESCDNKVLNGKLYYRIYETGTTPGSFQLYTLSTLTLLSNGTYRTKRRSSTVAIDLANGLNQGNYTFEIYFEAEVDINNDNISDNTIIKDENGNFYKSFFNLTSGGTGAINVNFPTKNNVSCGGLNDGDATVSSSNGTAPYTYVWSNGQTTATATNLVANTYMVTVTDASSMTGAANVVITEPSSVTPNTSATDTNSNSSMNGTAMVSPLGGMPPYTYLWSNNETTQTISGLGSGSYSVTVTDTSGCTGSQSVFISINSSVPITYCSAQSDFPWTDWISNVTFNQINKNSNKNVYNDYTSDVTDVETSGSYPISVESSFSWTTHDEYIRVWIDYNRDGVFQEPVEIAFSETLTAPAIFGTAGTVTGSISIPANAELGGTRMRVIQTRNAYASSCGNIDYGEIEDYTVNIIQGGQPVCTISATATASACDDAGTDSDSSDDTFTFDLNVTGMNAGTGWTAIINGQSESGIYGTTQTFGPFVISNGDIDFDLIDDTNNICTEVVSVIPPASCSNNVCTITGTVTASPCDDAGTDTDPADDTFTFDLTVTGTSTGAGWLSTINGESVSGSYDMPQTFGPFLISDGDVTFAVVDNVDNGCNDVVIVFAPASCSNANACSITATISNETCDDAGTGTDTDSDDDTFSFEINVIGTNTGPGWETAINGTVYTGTYNIPEIISGFLISDGDLSLLVTDQVEACAHLKTVVAPASCSNATPCSITSTIPNISCDDAGTDADSADDIFTFDLLMTGFGAGSGWETTINGSTYSGNYDVAEAIGPFLISNGNLSLAILDADNNCNTSDLIIAPSSCSNDGGPANYCASAGDFPWHDWISGVAINNLDKASGKSQYSDFTSEVANLVAGETVDINLTADFSWFTYAEYWKVWIDYNQDGVFDEPSEIAFSGLTPMPPNGTSNDVTQGTIDIPMAALVGNTRMRVAKSRDVEPEPCGNFDYGEVEDYTVTIAAPQALLFVNRDNLQLQAAAKAEQVDLHGIAFSDEAVETIFIEKSADGLTFEPLFEINKNDKVVFEKIDNSPYEGANFYRATMQFSNGDTQLSAVQKVNFTPVLNYAIFPNPASDVVHLKLEDFLGESAKILVSNQLGQPVFEENIAELSQPIWTLDVSGWREGSYMLWVQVDGYRAVTKRLMVMRF